MSAVIEEFLAGRRLVVADVGAAYGLPANLKPLEPVSDLLLFEPHPGNAEDLRRRYRAGPSETHVDVVEAALSGTGGERKLYVTNVPTGSSLLKPGSNAGLEFVHPSYFFPVVEINVATRRLQDVLAEKNIEQLDHIKLDVQGAELEILNGLGMIRGESLLGVEFEVGFPGGYVDQPQFGALDELMRSWGMELFDLRLARAHRSKDENPDHYPNRIFNVPGNSSTLSKRLWEADALYFRSLKSILDSRNPKNLKPLLALYCAYGFFVEAYHAVEKAEEGDLLETAEARRLKELIKAWHRSGHSCFTESIGWRNLMDRLHVFFSRVGRKLCGHRLARWID